VPIEKKRLNAPSQTVAGKRTLRSWFISAALLVAVTAVAVIAIRMREVARFELESEDRLQATILMCDLVAFAGRAEWEVASAPGRSWSCSRLANGPRFTWPADSSEVEGLVDVDFSYDLRKVDGGNIRRIPGGSPREATPSALRLPTPFKPMLERLRAIRAGH